MQIKIKRINNGKLPTYESDGAAGADCYARIEETILLQAGKVITIPLGFAVEVPEGYEMQIRPRSGLARKNGITVITGTIDSDYRGEVRAIVLNTENKSFEINPGDRIAQAVIAPVIKARWNEVKELSETKRGEGGFGSTGVSEIKVAYPHKIEKFYEPFKKISEVEKLIGKEVVIDNSTPAILKDVYWSDFLRIIFETNNGQLNMYSISAFERVTIDGHRFGKEMQFETEEN